MRIKAKLYPYPLLESCFGQEDYVDSKFNILVEQKNNGSNIELTFRPVLDNCGIQELINNGDADFAVHIESTLTSYRRLFRVKGSGLTIKISANDVENNINICTFIIANKDLNNYSNEKFNEDYDGFTFNIEKGNILAIGDSYELDINKEKDDVGNIQSIFGLIELKNEKEKDIKIDVSMEKINIALPKKEFNSFKMLMRAPENRAILHSMILIPALMEAIDQMKDSVKNGEFYNIQNKKWYRSLVKAAENIYIEIDEETILTLPSFETAQKLMSDTIGRGILGFSDLNLMFGGEE